MARPPSCEGDRRRRVHVAGSGGRSK
jgi:hypothetical protein